MVVGGKSLIEKYTRLTEKLKEHGADFILILGPGGSKKKARSVVPTFNSGFFSSLEQAPAQYLALC